MCSYNNVLANNNLQINSDKAKFDQTNDSAYFTGNVIVWFDDIILKTNNIQLIYKKKRNQKILDKIIIPCKFTAKKEQDIIIANHGEYFASLQQLVLTKDVKLQYQNHILHTKKLIYNTSFQKIEHIKQK